MRRRGFTITNLIVVIVIIVILFAILAVYGGHLRSQAQRLQDKTHIRGIHSGFAIWAGNNDDMYPLPSAIDVDNATVAELGSAKDTTGNILSVLAVSGYITAAVCVSPLEKSDRIAVYEGYQVEQPQAAVDPNRALWDPAFTADFTAEGGGHISYAHLIPQGPRLDQWSNTFKFDEAILSNRGPEMLPVERVDGNVITRFTNPQSHTTQFYEEDNTAPSSWSGNIAYNDNHVKFLGDLYTHTAKVGTGSTHRPISLANDDGTTTDYHDVLFADEEEAESNLFLGIFTTAGENKEDFTAIWD